SLHAHSRQRKIPEHLSSYSPEQRIASQDESPWGKECPIKPHFGATTGRGRLNHARLHASNSSGARVTSTAARLSSSCSGLLAPTMADVMPGWASTQATAT